MFFPITYIWPSYDYRAYQKIFTLQVKIILQVEKCAYSSEEGHELA